LAERGRSAGNLGRDAYRQFKRMAKVGKQPKPFGVF
jgi:hypothetical protein